MIQVGQVLDKYELLERVGQGGMSIVYRATDRSLRRTVAVKILHRHLADSAEARDRFEREAHAVAKLRHENIVEIFAYSGKTSEDSYIVTEFIDGSTLKEFLGDHPIAFPEVAAMIVLQVCRALAHAHAAGILHRDVKPENVMIRSDGVVKLMDFGISQMVDLQRLTVTGQLLGSPAYMSPEHVEGQPLDFRTDVFACGIVLYQLATGRLPFEGKNPHEILKRIADCKFADPRQANPRVGNELGRIILKAMAREPKDRYRDVGEMVSALDAYLTGSGLGPVTQELARYFQSPGSFEMALKPRLVDHLVKKGKETMAISRQQALEAFDRVLTVDPTNPTVLAVLSKLNDRQRWKRGAMIALALAIVAGGAYGARRILQRGEVTLAQISGGGGSGVGSDLPIQIVQPDVIRPALGVDAAVVAVGSGSASGRDPDRGSARPVRTPDAAVTQVALQYITVRVTPTDSTLAFDGGSAEDKGNGVFAVPFSGDDVKVTVANDLCEARSKVLTAADVGRQVSINLDWLGAQVVPRCATAGVTVEVDGKNARIDRSSTIPFGATTSTSKQVEVHFISEQKIDKHRIVVTPGKEFEVTCELIAIVAVVIVGAPVAAATPADDLARGRDEFKAGKHKDAIDTLNTLLYPKVRLSQPGDLVEAHILLGVCLFETGDEPRAAEELDAALDIDNSQTLDAKLFSVDARRFFDETKAAKAARDKAAADAKALALKEQALRDAIANLRVIETRPYWINFMPFGAGQFQNNQTGKGIFFAATEAVAAGTSIGIFFYLTNKYGYGGQVPKEDAGDVRLLQQIAIGADVVFYGAAIIGVVDAIRNYKRQVEVDKSSLPADFLSPDKRPRPKAKPTSRLLLHPIPIPDGAGVALTWEH